MVRARKAVITVPLKTTDREVYLPHPATKQILIAAEKSAPLRKIERASATAAYEHEDEAAPRPQAIASDLGESSGSRRIISPLEITACTTADSANPRTSAHRISHVIANAKSSASAIGDRSDASTSYFPANRATAVRSSSSFSSLSPVSMLSLTQ